MLSPNSKIEFLQVAWAQLSQFNKTALMTGIHMGKLNNINIYFNFNEQAKHDKFWNTGLESVHQYYINLISQTGAFHYYNPYVMQDLTYHNKPLNLPLYTNWDKEECPRFIHLPYSQTMLKWNLHLNKWEYEDHNEDSLSSCSSMTCSSCSCASCNIPSLTDPINKFELEDGEIV